MPSKVGRQVANGQGLGLRQPGPPDRLVRGGQHGLGREAVGEQGQDPPVDGRRPPGELLVDDGLDECCERLAGAGPGPERAHLVDDRLEGGVAPGDLGGRRSGGRSWHRRDSLASDAPGISSFQFRRVDVDPGGPARLALAAKGETMGEEAPLPKRRFLGYPKEQVEQILADRDLMLRHAEGRLRAGEARIAELEGTVTSLQQRNTALVASQVPREQLDAQATAFADLQRHNEETEEPP